MAAYKRSENSSFSLESSSEDESSVENKWKRAREVSEGVIGNPRRANSTRSRPGCSSKNAIMARVNRMKKKMYIGGLEDKIANLKSENRRARVMLGTQAERIEELDKEVSYLRGVLANAPEINRLLKGLRQGLGEQQPRELSLWSDLPEMDQLELPLPTDHTYTSPLLSACTASPSLPAPGVCFHIANRNVSLEFCSKCNERAIADWEGVTTS